MDFGGWSHLTSFIGFVEKPCLVGVKRVVVGEANGPHRAMLNHFYENQAYWDAGHSMNYSGWTHLFDFWAFGYNAPGTIRVAVGHAFDPHRAMLNHVDETQEYWNDPNNSMNYGGWEHFYEFWAYPDDFSFM